MRTVYAILYCIIFPFFNLVHPCRAVGREHIPEGGVLVCANHTAASDPFFLVFAFRLKHQVRAMAKAELIRVPVIGWLLSKAGVFGVDRGKADVGAIKQAMKFLKAGKKCFSSRRALASRTAERARPRPGPPCWPCGAASPSCRSISPKRKSGLAALR